MCQHIWRILDYKCSPLTASTHFSHKTWDNFTEITPRERTAWRKRRSTSPDDTMACYLVTIDGDCQVLRRDAFVQMNKLRHQSRLSRAPGYRLKYCNRRPLYQFNFSHFVNRVWKRD